MTLPKTILAPTDFSPIADRAVEQAFELAAALGATVHLLHAHEIVPTSEGLRLTPDDVDRAERLASESLEVVADRHRSSGRLGKLMLHLGDPRDVIARVAAELPADLIVMGTHGRRGVKRMMLGSVAEGVLRAVTCPVLAVRGHEPAA